ncbi:hypothetical protein [Fibrobacter sp. UWEL]|uniref:hypothetical protein n=1 Tax=Fibrobacter sp. UWEL TaxID=1896209 RepID=UPI00091EF064|nr:hypothetical protein [Fibrobacter sp. UWEL]SHK79853.1 hypothetical protein SAMN05720468_10723 [Fibrobacter sp. UWEL]
MIWVCYFIAVLLIVWGVSLVIRDRAMDYSRQKELSLANSFEKMVPSEPVFAWISVRDSIVNPSRAIPAGYAFCADGSLYSISGSDVNVEGCHRTCLGFYPGKVEEIRSYIKFLRSRLSMIAPQAIRWIPKNGGTTKFFFMDGKLFAGNTFSNTPLGDWFESRCQKILSKIERN